MADTGFFANADDHLKAAAFLDQIQAQLVSRYVARSGGKLTEATAHALINAESYLTAEQCIEHGFVTAKITDDLLVPPVAAGKALNYFKPQTPQNMAITPAEKQGIVTDVINGIKDWWKSAKNEAPVEPTNKTVELSSDGTTLYVDAAGDDIAQGDMVYTDAELTVAAADNTYPLEDGRSITVASGAITAITEASNAVDATNSAEKDARIAELEAQLAQKDTTITNVTNTVRSLQAQMKQVPGATGNPTPAGAQSITNKAAAPSAPKGSPFEITRT
jgi:hypothetical protein